MNAEDMAALCERVRAARPLQIRVCCPRGHFIFAVVLVTTVRAGQELPTIWPVEGRRHSVDVRWPRELASCSEYIELTCRKCPRWRRRYDEPRLATELAVYALNGHAEHRLSP